MLFVWRCYTVYAGDGLSHMCRKVSVITGLQYTIVTFLVTNVSSSRCCTIIPLPLHDYRPPPSLFLYLSTIIAPLRHYFSTSADHVSSGLLKYYYYIYICTFICRGFYQITGVNVSMQFNFLLYIRCVYTWAAFTLLECTVCVRIYIYVWSCFVLHVSFYYQITTLGCHFSLG